MRKQDSQEIPKNALNPKAFEDSQSQMFKVDHSEQIDVNHLHFFNKDTEIIKPGQKRHLFTQQLQQQKRSFYQFIAPYLTQALQITGKFTVQASKQIYQAMKTGAGWAYEQMVDKVIPFAVNQVPQFLFVVRKKKTKNLILQSGQFQYLGQDQEKMQKRKSKNEKTRVVVPLGQSDPQFQQFLKRENYTAKYSFPIDQSDQQQEKAKASESYMIRSESFQYIYDDCMKIEGYGQPEQQKIVYRLKDCAIFQLEGKNSIQYQLLDRIQKHKDTLTGSILIPQKMFGQKQYNNSIAEVAAQTVSNKLQTKKQVINQSQQQQERQFVQQGIEKKQKAYKFVDNTRNVRVQVPSFSNKNVIQKKFLYQ